MEFSQEWRYRLQPKLQWCSDIKNSTEGVAVTAIPTA